MIRQLFQKIFSNEFRARYATLYISYIRNTRHKTYPRIGRGVQLYGPLTLDPNQVTLEDNVRLQPGIRVIGSNGHLIIKKFTAIGAESLFVLGNHTPTVGLPQILSTLHINDIHTTIMVEEDCWIGARSTLLAHSKIGRGAVVGSCSVVTKPVPPYAVVGGNPAKIIAVRFNKEQIMAHEQQLYPEAERMTDEQLDLLFETFFQGKRSIGTSEILEDDRIKLDASLHEIGIKK